MNRKEFLPLLGVATIAVTIAPCLSGCKKNDVAPDNVDFTIDLNDAAYSALNSNGGSVSKDSIIIARSGSGSFIALS